ncbi:3-oxoadipate enol-lactonase [Pantoea sp. MBD-2R]|uniref:3-oxoadipate enol-lactonase n=1 Tax=Pantoea sp. MBD-2R TaxID=3141540 RepID=UPI00318345DA
MDSEYRLDGPEAAPVLILSNSLGTSWKMWDAQLPWFTQAFRVLRYNTRGHGNASPGDGKITLETLSNDVIALLDRLEIERAHFCGISLGGLTGLWLNRYAPTRFNRFVIANSAAKIGTAEAWLSRAESVRQAGMKTVAEGSAQRWFTDAFIDAHPDVVASLIAEMKLLSPEGYAACCEVLAAADLRTEVANMTRPMLLIAGQADPVTTLNDARWIQERAPAATCCTLPASHLSNVACAAEFSQQVLTYLTSGAIHGLND